MIAMMLQFAFVFPAFGNVVYRCERKFLPDDCDDIDVGEDCHRFSRLYIQALPPVVDDPVVVRTRVGAPSLRGITVNTPVNAQFPSIQYTLLRSKTFDGGATRNLGRADGLQS
jgi:hypothetical protein